MLTLTFLCSHTQNSEDQSYVPLPEAAPYISRGYA